MVEVVGLSFGGSGIVGGEEVVNVGVCHSKD